MDRLAAFRPLLLPVFLALLALTAFNLRINGEMADFKVYRTAGQRALVAAPLYQAGDGHFAFKYLPAFAVAMTPLAVLGGDAARVTWYALSCACLVLLLRWSVVALPQRRWSERSLILVALVLLAKFYAHELTLGQSNLLLGVLLMAALGALQLEAPRIAAVTLAIAVFIKPYALILLPWLVATYGIAAGLIAAGVLVGGLLLPALLYGWVGNVVQLSGWWNIVSSSTAPNLLGADNVSVASMWAKWLGPGTLASALAAGSVLLLLAVAVTMWRQRKRVAEPDYLEFAFLMLLIPLVSPQGWDYVLLLGTPAVICLIDRWRELQTPWRMASGLALGLMGLSLFDLMGRAAYGQFMAWAVVSVCGVVVAATLAQIRLRALA
ncbi:MAG: DUF2029 domain-containing protein [Acidobacteria bacterium]|nr:DUF2029 domain-containing protein [Acidobacteriota bacterium]